MPLFDFRTQVYLWNLSVVSVVPVAARVVPKQLSAEPFINIAPAPNGKLWQVATATGQRPSLSGTMAHPSPLRKTSRRHICLFKYNKNAPDSAQFGERFEEYKVKV
jgi:hypothetical protein